MEAFRYRFRPQWRQALDGLDVPTPLTDAVANMRVIHALEESAERG